MRLVQRIEKLDKSTMQSGSSRKALPGRGPTASTGRVAGWAATGSSTEPSAAPQGGLQQGRGHNCSSPAPAVPPTCPSSAGPTGSCPDDGPGAKTVTFPPLEREPKSLTPAGMGPCAIPCNPAPLRPSETHLDLTRNTRVCGSSVGAGGESAGGLHGRDGVLSTNAPDN